MSGKTATKRLREMLDERGVPYETNDDMGASETRWNGFTAYQLTPNAKLVMHPTPEQAIAATLGRGECENVGEPSDFCCSECGARLYTEMSDGYTMIECDEKTIIKLPRYCPNCGKAVKR